jgi:hypothetical protein
VQLIDVDPKSPDVGKRQPIQWRYRDKVGDYYTRPYTLSWMPAIGYPLRPHTRYAIIATRALRSPTGRPTSANGALLETIAGRGSLGAQWLGAISELEKAGVARS